MSRLTGLAPSRSIMSAVFELAGLSGIVAGVVYGAALDR